MQLTYVKCTTHNARHTSVILKYDKQNATIKEKRMSIRKKSKNNLFLHLGGKKNPVDLIVTKLKSKEPK